MKEVKVQGSVVRGLAALGVLEVRERDGIAHPVHDVVFVYCIQRVLTCCLPVTLCYSDRRKGYRRVLDRIP